jgi:hypothetical protein
MQALALTTSPLGHEQATVLQLPSQGAQLGPVPVEEDAAVSPVPVDPTPVVVGSCPAPVDNPPLVAPPPPDVAPVAQPSSP